MTFGLRALNALLLSACILFLAAGPEARAADETVTVLYRADSKTCHLPDCKRLKGNTDGWTQMPLADAKAEGFRQITSGRREREKVVIGGDFPSNDGIGAIAVDTSLQAN